MIKKILIGGGIVYFFLIISSAYAQTDSVNVLEFQNKKNRENIHVLKIGKKIKLKLKKGSHSYSYKGKLTAITDTNFIINNKYRVTPGSDSILDYRFYNHPFQKIILGTAGVGVFLFGTEWTLLAIVLIPELPVFAISYASIAVIGDVIFCKALTKNKHPIKNWNVSIKKIKMKV